MKRIITLILLADICACITMLIIYSILDSFLDGLYVGILTFGNIFLPTFGAVCIYFLIKRKILLKSQDNTILVQAIILFFLYLFGLFIWAIIDVYLFKTLSLMNVINDFESQFSGFLPVVFIEALLIPFFDFYLSSIKKVQ